MGTTRSYRTSEVAALLGYSDRTIRRRCEEGTIPAIRIGDGHYRISGEWVERTMRALGRPLDQPKGA